MRIQGIQGDTVRYRWIQPQGINHEDTRDTMGYSTFQGKTARRDNSWGYKGYNGIQHITGITARRDNSRGYRGCMGIQPQWIIYEDTGDTRRYSTLQRDTATGDNSWGYREYKGGGGVCIWLKFAPLTLSPSQKVNFHMLYKYFCKHFSQSNF